MDEIDNDDGAEVTMFPTRECRRKLLLPFL